MLFRSAPAFLIRPLLRNARIRDDPRKPVAATASFSFAHRGVIVSFREILVLVPPPELRAMRKRLRLFLVVWQVSLGASLSSLSAQESGWPATVAENAQLVSVYSDPRFFEGPVWDGVTGKLYFTAFGKEKSDTQILRLDEPGKVTVWADKTEGVNGMALGNDGRLIGAQAFGHRILSYAIGPNGPTDTQVLLFNPELNQPNDVAQAPNGDIYFTDPDFDGKNKTSAVHLLTANGQSRKVIEEIGRAHV